MSETKLTLTEIKKTIKEVNEENEALTKQTQEAFKRNTTKAVDLLKTLIKSTPQVEAVRWTQYTPYFNDGEECNFGVNDLEIKFSKKFAINERYDNGEGFVDEYGIENILEEKVDVLNHEDITELKKKLDLFSEVHGSLAGMENALREAFGDHVQVVVTKKGIETEEYEHD